jgi:uncharacterized protein (TIGR02145 family)
MNRVKFFLFTAIFIATALTFSCSSDDDGGGDDSSSSVEGKSSSSNKSSSSSGSGGSSPSECNSSPIIGGGGKGNDITNYITKKIDNQTWMAENLDYAVECSRCYDDDPANCAKYGRLYDWATAMALPASCSLTSCASQINAKHRGICPAGWHIPSNDEWDELENSVGGTSTAGKHLKAASDWAENGNGLDTYGFAALPGGYGYFGYFRDVGDAGFWWSSTEYSSGHAYDRGMGYDDEDVFWSGSGEDYLFSVRCVKD